MTAPLRRPLALVSDVDRTLLTHGHDLPGVVVAAARRAVAGGLRLHLASARSPVGLRDIAARLGAASPAICYNGAWIGDPVSGTALHSMPLPGALAEAVRAASRAARAVPIWYGDHGAAADLADAEVARAQCAVTGDLLHLIGAGEGLSGPGYKIMVVSDPEAVATLVADLRGRFGAEAGIVQSGQRLIEVVAAGVDKGAAAAWLARHLGLTADQVAAAGDAENDIGLLAWAGAPVTVANALAVLRERAFKVGPSCDEGGMAEVIDWLMTLPA